MLAEHLHKTLDELQRTTPERIYREVWLPRLEELKLIRIIRPPDPTKDGPPLVTKASIQQFNKDIRMLKLRKVKR